MESNSLNILWTDANEETSQLFVLMYATNSMIQHAWDSVTVIIWGATARLVAQNAQIQESIRVAMNVGVKFSACVACARQLGVINTLEDLGIEVIPWGRPLTEILKGNEKLLTI
jgi:hypothetical protein